MPESPRWLALTDRYDECLAVLQRIHGDKHDASNTFYAREYHQIRAQIELEKEQQVGITDIVRKASYRKRVLLIMTFYFFQQYVSPGKSLISRAEMSCPEPPVFCHKPFIKCRFTLYSRPVL